MTEQQFNILLSELRRILFELEKIRSEVTHANIN